jgi:hypothetical protein
MRKDSLVLSSLLVAATSFTCLYAADPPLQPRVAIRFSQDEGPSKSVPQPSPQQSPAVTTFPSCHWLSHFFCVKAPYHCKPLPCTPLCYEKCCDVYCGKPIPCPPSPCYDLGPCYCPKPPVCHFPGDPCPPCLTPCLAK